jgi:divalent metal cation (Fe/Co/Zn/Cd) transporter
VRGIIQVVTNGTHPTTIKSRAVLLQRGLRLEYATLGWNVVGCTIVLAAAVAAGSVALAGFGIDSVIEIVASTVVVWQLKGVGQNDRRRGALRVIAVAFTLLALYICVQAAVVLAAGSHPGHSTVGIVWLALTAAVMFALASGKRTTGAALDNPVLQTEARVTLIDGLLAVCVLIGVLLNAVAGWWWADPLSALVIVYYAVREGVGAWREAAKTRHIGLPA